MGAMPPPPKKNSFVHLFNSPKHAISTENSFLSAEGCFSSHNLPLAQSVRANSDLARSTPTQRRAGDDSA